MIPAYIAGPFAGPDQTENVRRACALSLWAVRQGYAPICVHPGIAAGAYGDDAVPADRERGLVACEALVRCVADDPASRMLVILRDDGKMSTGTDREVAAWIDERGPFEVVVRTWAEWVAAGVGP